MKEKEKALRKKMALDYLLAMIFGTAPNELAEHMNKIEQEKTDEDPFSSPPKELPTEPKPLKFLTNSGGERFKALKQKVLAKEQEQSVQTETVGEVDGSTGG